MKILKLLLPVFLISILFSSCEKEDQARNGEETQLIIKNYEELGDKLNSDFQSIGENIRNSNTDFGDNKAVFRIASEMYTNSPDQLNIFQNSFTQSQQKSEVENELSKLRKDEIQEILNSIGNYENFGDFKMYLDSKFDEIVGSNLSIEDKDYLLTYIVTYKSTIDFIYINQDLFAPEFAKYSKESWWDSWGQCATAISGGAVTGAVTLGLAGAAVGTVVLPIVGTVSAGAVGAIGGAIGGALTGAASGC